jgi:hypothetical protein
MVDDASWHITIKFLKAKEQAGQKVINYIMTLHTQNKTPCAICTDRGTKFINKSLQTWCQAQGIQI